MSDVRRRVRLEVAVASVGDVLAAESGGADRLELNAALALGGLTPSLGTLIEVKAAVRLPVMAIVRTRPAGFCYSPSDFNVMRRDADLALGHGADGIAFGALTGTGGVYAERCRLLVRQPAPPAPAGPPSRRAEFPSVACGRGRPFMGRSGGFRLLRHGSGRRALWLCGTGPTGESLAQLGDRRQGSVSPPGERAFRGLSAPRCVSAHASRATPKRARLAVSQPGLLYRDSGDRPRLQPGRNLIVFAPPIVELGPAFPVCAVGVVPAVVVRRLGVVREVHPFDDDARDRFE